jgi:hypothetical protein
LIERTSLGFTFFLLIENLVFCIDETKKAIQNKLKRCGLRGPPFPPLFENGSTKLSETFRVDRPRGVEQKLS